MVMFAGLSVSGLVAGVVSSDEEDLGVVCFGGGAFSDVRSTVRGRFFGGRVFLIRAVCLPIWGDVVLGSVFGGVVGLSWSCWLWVVGVASLGFCISY